MCISIDPLYIEDPLDYVNNVGSTCFRIQQIVKVHSLKVLELFYRYSAFKKRSSKLSETELNLFSWILFDAINSPIEAMKIKSCKLIYVHDFLQWILLEFRAGKSVGLLAVAHCNPWRPWEVWVLGPLVTKFMIIFRHCSWSSISLAALFWYVFSLKCSSC